MNKKSLTFNPIDVISGLIIVAGGILIIFSNVNIGILLTIVGSLFEALKIVLSQGLR